MWWIMGCRQRLGLNPGTEGWWLGLGKQRKQKLSSSEALTRRAVVPPASKSAVLL